MQQKKQVILISISITVVSVLLYYSWWHWTHSNHSVRWRRIHNGVYRCTSMGCKYAMLCCF